MTNNTLTAAVAAALFSSSLPLQAEQNPALIVTATRSAQTADETLAPVTVINRDDIERSQANSLAELLDGQPGITMVNKGGYGKDTSLSIRGTNGDHVLVLIDGVRIGSVTLGGAAFQYLPLADIERIEVVRGPRSSLYGSEAIGGVIQIFTRPGSETTRYNITSVSGSDQTASMSAGISGGDEDSRYSLQASRFHTDGINAREDKNPDRDGYDNASVSASLEQRFGRDTRLNLSLLHATGNNAYDGYTATSRYENDFVQQVLSTRLTTNLSDAWQMAFQLGESRDESENFKDDVSNSLYNSRRRQASWQNDFQLSDSQSLIAGIDLLRDAVESSQAYAEISRDNRALFTEWQLQAGEQNLIVSLRHDDNEAFGQHTTGNLDWAYRLGSGLRFNAGIGTAFKAPTFNDLYYPGSGNPDVKPEESESLELGLGRRGNHTQWSLRAYRTEVDNLIAWADDGSGTWRPFNVARAELEGLEAEVATRLAGWRTALNLNLLDARDADSDKRLIRRPERSAALDLDRGFGKLDVGISLRGYSERYDDAANTVRLAGYGLTDLRLAYAVEKNLSLRTKVGNLFDRDYALADGYNTAGRSAFVSLHYNH